MLLKIESLTYFINIINIKATLNIPFKRKIYIT